MSPHGLCVKWPTAGFGRHMSRFINGKLPTRDNSLGTTGLSSFIYILKTIHFREDLKRKTGLR